MPRSSRTLALIPLVLLCSSPAFALDLLFREIEHGDFLLIGNTLAQDCNSPSPIVGTVGACGSNTTDGGSDVYWVSDSPSTGQATASTAVTTSTSARSTAMLSIPSGATVSYAILYWAASEPTPTFDGTATLERPGVFSTPITDTSATAHSGFIAGYQSRVDVTTLVQTHGSGAYRLTGVGGTPLVNANDANAFLGWWMVVLYRKPTDPLRVLSIYDGFEYVTGAGMSSTTSMAMFKIPPSPAASHLGIIGYSGDNTSSGDKLLVNGTPFGDAMNPSTNFFNGTHSNLGSAVSTAGDLPQTTGAGASMSGIDLDVIDVSSSLPAGSTSLTVQGASTGDNLILGGCVVSVPTAQSIVGAPFSVVDENGGAIVPGDTLLYSMNARNTGDDDASQVNVSVTLPPEISYIAGSLNVTSGANLGGKTDSIDADQADYNSSTKTLHFYAGTGATGSTGGGLTVGASNKITFRVTVIGTPGSTISMLSNPSSTSVALQEPIIGGGSVFNSTIEACSDDTQCTTPTPHCKTSASPNICVQCLISGDCNDPHLMCNASNVCVCAPTVEVCDGVDNDCDGQIDEGLTLGPCSAGVGACLVSSTYVCSGSNGLSCPAVANPPAADDTCNDGIDNDCDGIIDNNCGLDSDGDGLSNGAEFALGTDPNDADSDDDGVLDGQEINPGGDDDNDQIINALDPDSDNDGLFDGTEMGLDCSNPDTALAAGHCVADADAGATKTNPVVADSDQGGLNDGIEDTNHDGKVDPGEKDPLNPTDDTGCLADSDCGALDSGKVCDVPNGFACIDGCRGISGNSCPPNELCSSTDSSIGTCSPTTGGTGGTGGTAGTGGTGGVSGTGGTSGSSGTSGTGGIAGSQSDAFPDLWGIGQSTGDFAGNIAGGNAGAHAGSNGADGRPASTNVVPARVTDHGSCSVPRGAPSSGRVPGVVALLGMLGLMRRRSRASRECKSRG